jgi:hypothetical protein
MRDLLMENFDRFKFDRVELSHKEQKKAGDNVMERTHHRSSAYVAEKSRHEASESPSNFGQSAPGGLVKVRLGKS